MKAQMFNFSTWGKETDPKVLKEKYNRFLKESGFCILGEVEHHFKPYGYTLLILLSESHFAIHTFPEEGKCYIEISSCIESPFIILRELITNSTVTADNGKERHKKT